MSEPTPEARESPEPVLLPFAVPTIWVAWACGPLMAIGTWFVRPFAESCVVLFLLGQLATIVLSLWLLALPGPHRALPEFKAMLAYVVCFAAGFAFHLDWLLRALAIAVPLIALARTVRARAKARSLAQQS